MLTRKVVSGNIGDKESCQRGCEIPKEMVELSENYGRMLSRIGRMRRRKKMKEYRVIYLNKELKLSRKKDFEQAQDTINQYVAAGWELQQVVTPSDLLGSLVGIFYKEK